MSMKFLDAAADWADRRKVDAVFKRDFNGWQALIRLSDSAGPFTAEVGEMTPRPKGKCHKTKVMRPAETPDEFEKRVAAACASAVVAARKRRIGRPVAQAA